MNFSIQFLYSSTVEFVWFFFYCFSLFDDILTFFIQCLLDFILSCVVFSFSSLSIFMLAILNSFSDNS